MWGRLATIGSPDASRHEPADRPRSRIDEKALLTSSSWLLKVSFGNVTIKFVRLCNKRARVPNPRRVDHQQKKRLPPETPHREFQSLLYIGKLVFISLELRLRRFGGGGGEIIRDDACECEGTALKVDCCAFTAERLFLTVVIVTPSPWYSACLIFWWLRRLWL